MRFILVGTDPQASAFTQAALVRGHTLVGYLPTQSPSEPFALGVPVLGSLAEIPGVDVDFLVLSGDLAGRGERLLEVLGQPSVDLVLSTPIAEKLEPYYELGLGITGSQRSMMALMPETVSPAFEVTTSLWGEIGEPRFVEFVQSQAVEADPIARFSQGWSWRRRLTGEQATVHANPADPLQMSQVLVTSRSESGILTTIRWLADAPVPFSLRAQGSVGMLEVTLPEGLAGAGEVVLTKEGHAQAIPTPAARQGSDWVERWEKLRGASPDSIHGQWQDALREFELSEAVSRSLKYGRAVTMTYEEVSEWSAFKSVMAAWGCGLIWLILLLLILAVAGLPWAAYAIPPMLILFLLLQLPGLAYRKPAQEGAGVEKPATLLLNPKT